jgi:hypothetical protein
MVQGLANAVETVVLDYYFLCDRLQNSFVYLLICLFVNVLTFFVVKIAFIGYYI